MSTIYIQLAIFKRTNNFCWIRLQCNYFNTRNNADWKLLIWSFFYFSPIFLEFLPWIFFNMVQWVSIKKKLFTICYKYLFLNKQFFVPLKNENIFYDIFFVVNWLFACWPVNQIILMRNFVNKHRMRKLIIEKSLLNSNFRPPISRKVCFFLLSFIPSHNNTI